MNILNKVYCILIIVTSILSVVAIRNVGQKVNYSTHCFTAVPIKVRELYLKDRRSEDFGNFEYPSAEYFAWKLFYPSVDNNFINYPDSLYINYFSYVDTSFYRAVLPIADFEPEVWKDYKKLKQYNTFSVGIANDGWVMLWCTNDVLGTKLLLRTQIKASEPNKGDLFYIKQYDKAGYIGEMFKSLSDSIRTNIANQYYLTDYKDSVAYELL
ncbi:DUF2931 family protein [Sphingobacterium sp. SYP-B4668]|uniref:DUF2931 family protein n=1 Tax=Sphingobacterium sp. SYP-B4668 TaxID=2996035 RepID=UPI0022DE5C76|nr:DUF2931 family protein [Sphingobacterium sp. SYP-B4668]